MGDTHSDIMLRYNISLVIDGAAIQATNNDHPVASGVMGHTVVLCVML